MKVLIIEDDIKLAQMLKTALKKEGVAADCVADGVEGERRIELHHTDYDLVILDLMLPGKEGDQICRGVRERGISIPILVLTAKSSVDNKISLLDLGADDYMIKPFSLKELLARIRALHRRPEKSLPPKDIVAGDLVLSLASRNATRSGKPIKLTLTEFKLLEYLLMHSGEIVTRDQILNNLWDFDFDSFSNVVDVHIKNLRKKIDSKYPQKLLETIRGVGYRLHA